MDTKFYNVVIGTISKKQHFIPHTSFVCSFNGSLKELKGIMYNRYKPFSQNITEIEHIESLKQESKQEDGLEIISNRKEFTPETTIEIQLEKYVDAELLKKYTNLFEEWKNITKEMKEKIKSKLEERIEVACVAEVKCLGDFNSDRALDFCWVRIWLKNDIYIKEK